MPWLETSHMDQRKQFIADYHCLFQSVDAADISMIRGRERLRFPPKPREAIWIGGERVGQDLDRDGAIQLRVPRAVDFTHAAGAERRQDLVRAEACAGG